MKAKNDSAVPLVSVRHASKTYQGVHAIEDVDFDVERGEIHGLLGENGAGKSTLCKALAGVVSLSSGRIEINGAECQFRSPADALRAGVTMVFQETSLVPTMTVAQNIYLGFEPRFTALRPVVIRAQQILQSMSFHVDPRSVVARLSAAQKQMVEIARAVFHESRLIVFDEPTATLTPEEKQHFFSLMEKLRRQGVSIIFISHAVEECLSIADRITVLRDGHRVITAPASELTRESIVRYMVGRDVARTVRRQPVDGEDSSQRRKVLSVENVIMGDIVKNMSFSIFAGEVACMAGLIGSGRTETMKIVAGALKRNLLFGGTIRLEGKPVRYRVPAQAVKDGIVYVTEDRKLNGFFETMSISENIYMGWLAVETGNFLARRSVQKSVARDWLARLAIRSINPDARVNELSGGNQQKVVIAKSLVQKPKLIIFDEPTRGVDVGSISEIHGFIRHLADEGVAVVVISSYLPEVIGLADRVLVVRQGRVVEEFTADRATEERIMFAAVH
jgi:ABC-type sugar transport system ATPase subunit